MEVVCQAIKVRRTRVARFTPGKEEGRLETLASRYGQIAPRRVNPNRVWLIRNFDDWGKGFHKEAFWRF